MLHKPMTTRRKQPKRPGFTLVELMVAIVIVAVLAAVVFTVGSRAIAKASKTQVLQQMRDLAQGFEAYAVDYGHPPVPGGKKPGSNRNEAPGWDTIYGDPPQPNRNYGNEPIIVSLMGESDRAFRMDNGETFYANDLNPKGERYLNFPYAPDNRNGVGEDGRLYDPWGRELIIAINAHAPNSPTHERILETYGLGEWTDRKPRYESYAFWSYGKDGEKAETYANSDDVAFW